MSDIGRVHCVYCSEARKKCSCIRFKKDPELHHALVNLMWLIVFRFLVMMNVLLIPTPRAAAQNGGLHQLHI